jgi:hypothetical protein
MLNGIGLIIIMYVVMIESRRVAARCTWWMVAKTFNVSIFMSTNNTSLSTEDHSNIPKVNQKGSRIP